MLVTSNEQLPVSIENYSYAKFISEVVRLCKLHKLDYQIIGQQEFTEVGINYPIYRIIINPEAALNIGIVAGIHATEIAGPFSILHLLDQHKTNFHPQVRYYIYPMLNPMGFDLRQRNNPAGKDLNAMYKTTLHSSNYHEMQEFHNDVKDINFHTFISLHEDVNESGFYAYVFERSPQLAYRALMDTLSQQVDILANQEVWGDQTDDSGLIINVHDHSPEDAIFGQGKAKLSICTETPGKAELGLRIQLNLTTIKFLSDYAVKSSR